MYHGDWRASMQVAWVVFAFSILGASLIVFRNLIVQSPDTAAGPMKGLLAIVWGFPPIVGIARGVSDNRKADAS